MRVLTLDVSNKSDEEKKNLSKKPPAFESFTTNTSATVHSEENEVLPKWTRSGNDIKYVQNEFTNESSPYGLYKVSFTFELGKGPKEIYFAHSIPYTYSMLCDYLTK